MDNYSIRFYKAWQDFQWLKLDQIEKLMEGEYKSSGPTQEASRQVHRRKGDVLVYFDTYNSAIMSGSVT